MKKDSTLVKLYHKIHNKQPLTLDDLRYLAEYAPDCFEKTCKKIIHDMPQAKPIMESATDCKSTVSGSASTAQKRTRLDIILDNLVRMEADELMVTNIDADSVKNLLGSLYMELLLEHSDQEILAELAKKKESLFDTKI